MRPLSPRSLAGAVGLSLAALAFIAQVTSAHPLGNFTINHYSGVRVQPDAVVIDHVTDFAEIPTFTERRQMDTDRDGQVSTEEAAAYEAGACTSTSSDLRLALDGHSLGLVATHTGLSFPMGQGSLTMRLVCVYSAVLERPLTEATELFFSDTSYAERRGWREITVEGDGTTIFGADAPPVSTSARLTTYPRDLLAIPLGQTTTSFSVKPGGPILPPLALPDAHPVQFSSPASPAEPETSVVAPTGVGDLGADVTALFQAPDLTPVQILLGLIVAAALGAFHALSPGHGKTVMAAYLVGSRGNARHALGLGLTVTVSHTLGVLALGALTVSASWVIPPERLYPILSVISGAIVVGIGGYLLIARVGAWRRERVQSHAHGHGHDHEHEHDKPQSSRPAGWHEHDGIGHTHLPPEGMGRRGLFALGLSGGMVPSVSALLVLIGSISIGRPIYGVVLTIAFGAGMAAVLVGLGLVLVYARRLVTRLPAAMPMQLDRRLPILTAAVVLAAGLLITGQGLVALG